MLTVFAVLMLWRLMFPPPLPVEPKDPSQQKPPLATVLRTPLDELLPFAEPTEESVAESPTMLSLGSLDPASGYRMQANFASRGGVLHRLQLSSPNYRDIDDRSGHLGELELTEDQGGLRIQTVPAGSVAAAVGLEVGDVIQAVGTNKPQRVQTTAAWTKVMQRTRPGQQLTIELQRAGVVQTVQAELKRVPLQLIRPEAENIALHSNELPEGFVERQSFELQISSLGPLKPSGEVLDNVNRELRQGVWRAEQPNADTLVFRKRIPEFKLEFVKTFVIDRAPTEQIENGDYPAYDLDLSIEVRNLASQPQTVAYGLMGPAGLPIEGWWYSNKIGKGMFTQVGIRDVIVRVFERDFTQIGCAQISGGNVEPIGQGSSIAFAGVDAQYFASAMLPAKESKDEIWIDTVQAMLASTALSSKLPVKYNNTTFVMTRKPVQLAALGVDGSTQLDDYVVFAGPKKPELLEQYLAAGDANHNLGDFLYYGWFWWVAKPMLFLLHSFAWLVGNHGVAIIMLTVVVRGCMFPISRKQAKSMAKMQELKPELDRITAKYKDDMQKRAAAQQALWKQHGYNPMSGCLPMFLQLPIFIGLYRSLMVDVELRQTPLFSESIRWCSNLAAPDMAFDWSSWWPQWFINGHGVFALGPYVNVLPLATVGLFILQQKMFMPPATDEQTAMTQKIMQYMMFFMGLMFFKVASGLCLYFIASSVWGIAERKLIPKPQPVVSSIPEPTVKKKIASDGSQRAAEKARRKKKSK
jgi:YidC/Oxa1 family membrane protein insertase